MPNGMELAAAVAAITQQLSGHTTLQRQKWPVSAMAAAKVRLCEKARRGARGARGAWGGLCGGSRAG
jgi:hypothetical protein